MITIIDVMRDLRIEPTRELSWSIGARVREMWQNENGELPEKRLREKTAGEGGSHCFAVYPTSWHDKIVMVILQHRIEETRQFNLPLWD